MKREKILFIFLFAIFFLPYNIHAATLTMTSGAGESRVGQKVTIDLEVKVERPINAVEGWVSFPHEILQVERVLKGGSVMEIWAVEPEIDNSSGLVHFVAGLPYPGYGDGKKQGHIASLIFKAISPGEATISYTDGSKVVLGDGFGTLDKLTKESALISVLPADRYLAWVFIIVLVVLFIIIYGIKNYARRF